MAIAQKGLAELQEIIQRSNAEASAISGRIRGLDGEYQALGNQKFAPKEGPQILGSDEGTPDDDELRRKGEQEVHDAVAGNQEAAERVEDMLHDQAGPGADP
jgi:hypothetical protein